MNVFLQLHFTLTMVLRAPTMDSLTCLMIKNAMMQLNTPNRSIARPTTKKRDLGETTTKGVLYMIQEICILIYTPPEEVTLIHAIFARKVISNFQ